MMSKTSYNQLQTYLIHCTVFWHKWPVHDLVLVIPPPSLIKVASNRRPYSKLGGTTLNGREEGGQYYISHTRQQERFAARKVVFSWECLNIFATGCSSCAYSKFIHPCLRYPFLQHQISNYQQILCHVFWSWTTEEFIFPAICIGVRLSNALPQNIEKSASGNLSKKQMHETLSCINIFKQENLCLTPSSILDIIIKNL